MNMRPRPPLALEAGVVHRLGEDRAEVGPRVLVEEDADDDDDGHADDVPPDGHVVEDRDQPDAERVQQAVEDQHHAVDRDRDRRRHGDPEGQVQERGGEQGETEVDARRDRDLPDEIEPADEPAPLGGAPARLGRELGRPVVEAARGRVARGDLSHAQGDQGHEEPDEEPAEGHDGRTADVHREAEQRQAAGQDRDDRERDGEVGERPHPPAELLGVAELVELLRVPR